MFDHFPPLGWVLWLAVVAVYGLIFLEFRNTKTSDSREAEYDPGSTPDQFRAPAEMLAASQGKGVDR